MKKIRLITVIVLLAGFFTTGCSKCKECTLKVGGISVGEPQKICGEDLERAEALGMTCE